MREVLTLSTRRAYRVWRALAYANAHFALEDEALEALNVRLDRAREILAGGRP